MSEATEAALLEEGSLQRYFAAAAAVGCPKDQVLRFASAAIVLQPRQLRASRAARECDEADGPTEIGYGGARGGGKSYWLLAQMGADDCQRLPGAKCLLLRKVGKANIEHFEDLRRTVLSALPHTFAAYRGILTFANGSRIVAGHFQSDSDIDAYLGLEYDVIGVEEATTLSSKKYEQIRTCCRSSKAFGSGAWRPRIYSTTNPGGIGHAWYRQRFIVPFREKKEVQTRFIPAMVNDNRFNNADYAKNLESLSGWQRKAWYEGDWDLAAGQYFTNWQHGVHVVQHCPEEAARSWHAALDYGFTHYTVCLLGFQDGDGRWFIVDEHAERRWLPQRHAASIKSMLARHGCGSTAGLRSFVAGADVFSQQSDGTTVAGQYARVGVHLRRANTERVMGWAELLGLMGDVGAGQSPRIFVHSRCRRLIETIPALQHDPARPEDVLKADCDDNGIGGDDCADALRYLVATRLGGGVAVMR